MMRALAITGPTAVGKTALSLAVAERYGCDIVSLDSMQIYRGMDIGTAKLPPADRRGIAHYLIDICEPSAAFSAADYAVAALQVMQDITARERLPLLVGGTGLYLSTLLRPETPTPPADATYHAMREEQVHREGIDALYEELCHKDAESAASIHKNNVRRVIRALEIYDKTGLPKSYFDAQSRACAPRVDVCHMTLCVHDRERLYARCDARVEAMLREGLIEEVRALYDSGRLLPDTTAAQAIGYKEMLAYVRGDATREACVAQLKLSTRHYVKRQLTWFSHCDPVYPVFADTEDGTPLSTEALMENVNNILQSNGIMPNI